MIENALHECVTQDFLKGEDTMKLLAVIDMQNDFIDGALGPEEAVQIVPLVKEKIDSYLAAEDAVVFTRDTHTEAYLETQEGRNLPVTLCVRGTKGWEIREGVYAEGCHVIDKPSFGSLELAEYAAELDKSEKLESVELIGLCTDICVISNAMIIKARLPEVPVLVDAACCAGVSSESHKNALQAMKVCQIQIVNE